MSIRKQPISQILMVNTIADPSTVSAPPSPSPPGVNALTILPVCHLPVKVLVKLLPLLIPLLARPEPCCLAQHHAQNHHWQHLSHHNCLKIVLLAPTAEATMM
eukprot:TRINITY_DN15359_c0_g1_i1.p1 TRINITY_DN15359_c0_g1~~TRINITY_DN15359_c0_g1_i1.p1  ORF type:complete len:103 (-),score=15.11 TRINITY_DN15359_c0_g1_i1:72-380(-)